MAEPTATAARPERYTARQLLIAGWGIGGILALLGQAIWRLSQLALEPLQDHAFTWWQVLLYALWLAYMAWSEGYRGFQRSYAPRAVARAFHLARAGRPALFVAFAPVFCMTLFHATRRKLIVAWGLLAGIVVLVVLVHQLDQPWRGLVDGGVMVGLVWGVTAIVAFFVRALDPAYEPPGGPALPDK